MNPFQTLYNKIRYWNTPAWVKVILQGFQDMIIQIATDIGKEYLEAIKDKIESVHESSMTGEQKFDEVFKYIKTQLKLSHITDRVINMVIEILYNRFRAE